jgi:hypothetical protein
MFIWVEGFPDERLFDDLLELLELGALGFKEEWNPS